MSWDYRVNIFDQCNLIGYNSSTENYNIVYEIGKCLMYFCKDNMEKILINNPQIILEKYNIFDGKVIGVDHKSFLSQGLTIEQIREIILQQYSLSYIYKLLLERNLPKKYIEKYLERHGCQLLEIQPESHDKHYRMKVRDNLKTIWCISAFFDERPWDDYEPYYSRFSILK